MNTASATLELSATVRRRVIRGGAILTASKALAQGLSFARNVILARYIGIENFGIASTFAITLSVLDVLSSLSVDKLLIQAPDGDNESLQGSAHAVQAIKAAIGAALVLALASPLASLFSAPNTAWAFRLLALTILLRGLCHLDVQRAQRQMDFSPVVAVEIAQQLLPTIAAWPLAIWLRDYTAVLWVIVLQAATGVIASFLVAKRPYRWNWNTKAIKRFLRFGWPLVINGVLLFGIYQGDRFLIASAQRIFGTHAYSLTTLGAYSAAATLTLGPMAIVGGISSSLLLPLLARCQSDRPRLTAHYRSALNLLTLAGVLYAFTLILCGRWLLVRLYGDEYAIGGTVVTWLAAAQAFRIARFAPTLAAMACGDTKNGMLANSVRFSFLLPASLVVMSSAALHWIAIAACVGEFLGLILSLVFLRLRQGIRLASGITASSALVASIACGTFISSALSGSSTLIRSLLVLTAGLLLTAIFFLFKTSRVSSRFATRPWSGV